MCCLLCSTFQRQQTLQIINQMPSDSRHFSDMLNCCCRFYVFFCTISSIGWRWRLEWKALIAAPFSLFSCLQLFFYDTTFNRKHTTFCVRIQPTTRVEAERTTIYCIFKLAFGPCHGRKLQPSHDKIKCLDNLREGEKLFPSAKKTASLGQH